MRNQPFLVLNTMRIANIAHFPVLFAELFHEKLEFGHLLWKYLHSLACNGHANFTGSCAKQRTGYSGKVHFP